MSDAVLKAVQDQTKQVTTEMRVLADELLREQEGRNLEERVASLEQRFLSLETGIATIAQGIERLTSER